MTRIAIKKGRRYYCQLLGSADNLGGTFAIDRGDIRLSLVRFDGVLKPDPDVESYRVRTEENWIASMFELVPGGWTSRGGGSFYAHERVVTSNVTLIGSDAWDDEDRVKRVSFRVPGADDLFTHAPLFQKVIDSRLGGLPELTAFKVTGAATTTKAWLAPSGNLLSRRPRDVIPWFEIAFPEGVSLLDMHRASTRVVRFLSALSGVFLDASDVYVSRYSEAEYRARVDRREPVPEHAVHYYEEANPPRTGELIPHRTLASLHTVEDRQAVERSLQIWLERDDKWMPATAMMMESLSLRSVMSPTRLLSATRWLEEVPGTGSLGVIPRAHAKALGKLVGNAAAKLGYGTVAGRFTNAVSKVALESNRDRFQRLVGSVRGVFGSEIIGDDMVDWLCEAMRMRGQAAHGATAALDDEYDVFAGAVYAAECMNMLLTLKDLPIGTAAVARANDHLLVQSYRAATMGRTPKQVRAAGAATSI